jgi:hypothetical protein
MLLTIRSFESDEEVPIILVSHAESALSRAASSKLFYGFMDDNNEVYTGHRRIHPIPP